MFWCDRGKRVIYSNDQYRRLRQMKTESAKGKSSLRLCVVVLSLYGVNII